MSIAPEQAPFSSDREALYPALPAETRQVILDHFIQTDDPFFPGFMGFHVAEVRRGYARLTVENRRVLCNPVGIMHGGASFGLADTAVAAALISLYGFGNAFLTVEMKINYLEAIPPGAVVCEAYVLRSTKRTAYAESDVWAQGKLAARASTNYMIRPIPPPA